MILWIDNYDSFSYNLVQLIGTLEPDIKVIRNDELSVEQVAEFRPDHIILSPGPCYPKQAGICEQLVTELAGKIPILGVCLGHQAICEAFGGKIVHAKELMHGKQDRIKIDSKCRIFSGLDEEFDAARYHSLIAERESLPDCLEITAEDKLGEVMAVRHKEYDVFGVQFHPESILTPQGKIILENFLKIKK